MNRSLVAAAGIAAVFVLAAPLVRAEGYIVTIGGGLSAYPPYEGAGHDVFTPVGVLGLRRADKLYRFTPPDGGTSLGLISTRYVVFGPVVRFRLARGDTGNLAGLDRVGFAVEPGAFLELWPTNWFRGRVEGRYGVIGYNGFVGDAGLDLIHTGKRWLFSVGPRIGFGDAKYFDTYFGVTPAEAAISPYIHVPYDPGSGRRYTGVEVAAGRHLNSHFDLIADFGYHRLSHDAADSPIVQVAGSPNDYSGGITLRYSFKVGR